MRKKKRLLWLIPACIALALMAWWLHWENTSLQVTTYTVSSAELPEGFDGFRIAQISDLHNAQNDQLIAMLQETAPDIIVLTGDLVDSRRTDIEAALQLVQQAVKLATCYYVTGNHEARMEHYDQLAQGLREAGVTILDNEAITLQRGGSSICLVGLTDAGFQKGKLASIPAEAGVYTIALAHRPEYVDTYVTAGYDLVFCGHAHGGQIRLPWIGGLVAPGQGLFPQYDCGLYRMGDTQMLVSRGIGNSLFPQRLGNRPELVLAQLEAVKELCYEESQEKAQ